jgi:nucleotide-binding universal stress UspA family protein
LQEEGAEVQRAGHNEYQKGRHILIAVDESENAKRAVQYVADLLGGIPGFRVALVSIIPEPTEDVFAADEDRQDWIRKYRSRVIVAFEDYRGLLLQAGFEKGQIEVVIDNMYCPSVAECIIYEQKKLGCSTIVLGRKGVSKREEILFGSTSNKILHEAKDCAVWVIE